MYKAKSLRFQCGSRSAFIKWLIVNLRLLALEQSKGIYESANETDPDLASPVKSTIEVPADNTVTPWSDPTQGRDASDV